MSKKDKHFLLMSSFLSFLLGSIFVIVLIRCTSILKIDPISLGSQTYEKNSLALSVSKIYDAVVYVDAYSNKENIGSGTGFFYKVDNQYGYILTNEHIVRDADKVKIVLSTDEEVEAKILGREEYLDLAVLRINKKVVPLVALIGSSEKMNVGDTIFTVGAPLGYNYRGSVTSGVLSGKNRMVSFNVFDKEDNNWVMEVLQIDASINRGNSGGPLVNVNGEVVGICTMKLANDNVEGMGFAIPIEFAMNYVDLLESDKKIEWPTLGISMINVTDREKISIYDIQLPDDMEEGVVVLEVKDDSVAKKLGLQKGDVITKVGKNSVKDIAYLKYELYQFQIGEEVSITYLRDNHTVTKKAVLK